MNIMELDEVANAPEKENLMIVDGLNLAFRFKHRGLTDFKAEYLRTVQSLAKSYGAKKVVIAQDIGSSSFRRELHPGYKQDRKDKFKNQTPEEEQAFLDFFKGFEETMKFCEENSNYEIVGYKGVEADDIAAYIVKNQKDKYPHIWLISSDADWDLLLSRNVSRFSFVTRKEYTLDNFYEYHSCDSPEEFVSIKVLVGDIGDSIYGIPNVGVKRAYNLLRTYGTALDLHDSIPLEGKGKVIQNINDSKDLIMLNYQLIDLLSFCEDAIGEENLKDLKGRA